MELGVADNRPEVERDKGKVGSWRPRERITRREEVVLNRLRAGHCLLTHESLMDNRGPQMHPICGFCNNAILTMIQ